MGKYFTYSTFPMYTLFPERRYFMFCFKWTRFLGTDHEKALSPSAYFSSLPHLRTDRLLLRPLQRKDAKDIFSYASDPEVARYVLWEPHQSISDTRSYISYMLSLYRHGYPGSWAVVHQKTGSVIGTIGFPGNIGTRDMPLNHSAQLSNPLFPLFP